MTAKTGGYEYRVCPFKDAHQEEGKSKVRCAIECLALKSLNFTMVTVVLVGDESWHCCADEEGAIQCTCCSSSHHSSSLDGEFMPFQGCKGDGRHEVQKRGRPCAVLLVSVGRCSTGNREIKLLPACMYRGMPTLIVSQETATLVEACLFARFLSLPKTPRLPLAHAATRARWATGCSQK